MDYVDYFYKLLEKGPLLAICSISLAGNVIFLGLYLKANAAYISLLKDNSNIVKQLSKFFDRFKVGELSESESDEKSEKMEK